MNMESRIGRRIEELAKRVKPRCAKCGQPFTMKRHECKPTSMSEATLKVGPL
jgi:hypothetical protein